MRAHRTALALLLGGLLAIVAAYASVLLPRDGASWGSWAMAIGTSLVLVAFMLLGLAKAGRALGLLWLVLGFTVLVCVMAFGAALLLSPAGDTVLFGGLPRRAAIVLYGVGLLPLVVLPVAYALTFDRVTLSEADLARVRAATASERST
jgi:hypothetical protein